MKKILGLSYIIVILLGACSSVQPRDIGFPAGVSKVPTPTPKIETTDNEQKHPVLSQHVSWHLQYSGKINYDLDVDVYNIDLFDTDAADITRLHQRGVFVMCYFSAGSLENWRPDADQFTPEILGKAYEGWDGETWLDIRNLSALGPIMSARLELAAQKGCDGVDPDNINGYENNTGFPLSYSDQITYNIWLAEQARARGLAIGLKNDLAQISDLQPLFDWEINESCFEYDECQLLQPFIQAGKPVFVIEYNLKPEEFCPQANEMNLNAAQKKPDLGEYNLPCR